MAKLGSTNMMKKEKSLSSHGVWNFAPTPDASTSKATWSSKVLTDSSPLRRHWDGYKPTLSPDEGAKRKRLAIATRCTFCRALPNRCHCRGLECMEIDAIGESPVTAPDATADRMEIFKPSESEESKESALIWTRCADCSPKELLCVKCWDRLGLSQASGRPSTSLASGSAAAASLTTHFPGSPAPGSPTWSLDEELLAISSGTGELLEQASREPPLLTRQNARTDWSQIATGTQVGSGGTDTTDTSSS